MKSHHKKNLKLKEEEEKPIVSKNYFAILKDLEKKKDEILPKKKPYEPKAKLKEKIYNDYSNHLGEYYKNNKNSISLYGSTKYENLSIDELVEEMGQYKETILTKIKNNPELLYSNPNYLKLTKDNIILTPLPIEQKKHKLKIDTNEFYKAERTGVVMRTIEYTNRLGKKVKENNINQKIYIIMKNAVDKITKFWKKNNNKENLKKYHIRKGVKILKKSSLKKSFKKLKEFIMEIDKPSGMNFKIRNNYFKFKRLINKNGFNRCYFWDKIIYYYFNINQAKIMRERIINFLKRIKNKNLELNNNPLKEVILFKNQNNIKRLPIINYHNFLTKIIFDLNKLKLLQNNIKKFLKRKVNRSGLDNYKIKSLYSSNLFPLNIIRIKPYIMTKQIKFIYKNNNNNKNDNIKLQSKNKNNDKNNYINNNIISLPIPNINNSYITKIRTKSPILKRNKNQKYIFDENSISNDISIELSHHYNYYKRYAFYFIKTILRIAFVNLINRLRDNNIIQNKKLDKFINTIVKTYLKFYFLKWIDNAFPFFSYSVNVKKRSKYPKPTFRLKAFSYSKYRRFKNKKLHQIYFGFTYFRNFILKKNFNRLKNNYYNWKIRNLISIIKNKWIKELFYRLILNCLFKNNININNKEIINLLKFGSNCNLNYNKRLGKILNLNLTKNSKYDNSLITFNDYIKKLLFIHEQQNKNEGNISDNELDDDTINISISPVKLKNSNYFPSKINKKNLKIKGNDNEKITNNSIKNESNIKTNIDNDTINIKSIFTNIKTENNNSNLMINKKIISHYSTHSNNKTIINNSLSKSVPKDINNRIQITRSPKYKDKIELRDSLIYDFPY